MALKALRLPPLRLARRCAVRALVEQRLQPLQERLSSASPVPLQRLSCNSRFPELGASLACNSRFPELKASLAELRQEKEPQLVQQRKQLEAAIAKVSADLADTQRRCGEAQEMPCRGDERAVPFVPRSVWFITTTRSRRS